MNYIQIDINALDKCLLESASMRRDKHAIISVALQIAFAFIQRDCDEMNKDSFRVAVKRSGLTMREAKKVMEVCPSVLEEIDGNIKCHLATPTIQFSSKQSERVSRRYKKELDSTEAINAHLTKLGFTAK